MKHFIIYIVALLAVCSCKTKVVTVPEYHTEYCTNTVHDSVYVEKRDSFIMKMKGDTVTIEHWNVRYRDRYIEVTDTFIKTDSIPVPYPVPAELSRWQRFCCDYGKVMLGGTAAAAIFIMVAVIRWIRRKNS